MRRNYYTKLKSTRGYIEWKQTYHYISDGKVKPFPYLSACAPIWTPVLLNDQFQYIYLDFKDAPKKKLLKCFKPALLNSALNNNYFPSLIPEDPEELKKIMPWTGSHKYRHFPFEIKYDIYDERTLKKHTRRCKVRVKGVLDTVNL